MNKDDILAKSRDENKNGDEREEKIRLRSYATSAVVGAFVCMMFVIIESFFDRSISIIWAIYSAMMFTKHILDAIQLKKRSDIGFSIMWGIVFVLQVFGYILDNIG